MTILLVDDDAGMRHIWRRWLMPIGAEVREAQDVSGAIDQMRKIPPPDLILLDLRLAASSADQTVASIATLRAFNPNLAVLAISGMTHDSIIEAIEGTRVEAVAVKDQTMSQVALLKAIKQALCNTSSGELLCRVNVLAEEMGMT